MRVNTAGGNVGKVSRAADGRFVAQRQVERPAGTDGAEHSGKRALRPSECHKHLQVRLAGAFPEIVTGFIQQAKQGGPQHLKLTNELLEKAAEPARKKGSAQRMFEKLERLERARATEADREPERTA